MKEPVILRGALNHLASHLSSKSRPNFDRMSSALDPAYTALFSSPSSSILNPSSYRKLLILDLNGSLLFRPKRYTTHKSGGGDNGGTTGTGTGAGTRQRVVHPRPYMPSFREYLFHPETKRWLETMVWSSAQPHSVQEMVQRTFGARQRELKAIWARDTLGLDPRAYRLKSVTIKDLSKIWKAFPAHSAKTTLLVDDSMQKARLQPWNHIYIKEYGQVERRSDCEHLAKIKPQTKTKSKPKHSKKEQAGVHAHDTDADALSSVLADMDLSSAKTKVKTSLDPPSSSSALDCILLAVIGILDALKHQDNVSGWLRSGGIVLCGAEGAGGGGKGGVIGDAWFDTVHIVNWWANRGRAALAELGIEEVDGVVPEKLR